jgi:hypothetical protein
MTIFLLRSFCFVLIFIGMASWGMAADSRTSIEVLAGGRSFDSIEAYTAFKSPSSITQDISVPVFTQDVLGITSPLGQILQDFQRSALTGPLCPRSGLAEAIERAIDGKQGPLLLVADVNKVRIMELKPEVKAGTNP